MAKNNRSIEATFHTLEEYLTYWGLPKSSLEPVCAEIRRHIDSESFDRYIKGLDHGSDAAEELRKEYEKEQERDGKTVTTEGYAVRENDGLLFVAKAKPWKCEWGKESYWIIEDDTYFPLPNEAFPSVTGEDSEPAEVQITIRLKEKDNDTD